MSVPMPEQLTNGYVVDRILIALGDGPDEDRLPDARAAEGMTVTFKPSVEQHVISGGTPVPTRILRTPTACVIGADGYLRETATAEAGVWLPTGSYTVSYKGGPAGYTPPTGHPIEVTDAHTEASPLYLTSAAPHTPPGPAPVTVLSVSGSPVPGYVVGVTEAGTLAYVEAPEGTGGGATYDDTAITGRVTDLETADEAHDSRLDALEQAGYVQTTDARLSDARTPTAHTQAISTVTGLQAALDGKQATGSYATNTALTAHTGSTANPHSVTKSQVGLGNVDNTSDAAKPISTATQTALDGKSATSHNHTGTYATPTDVTTASTADRARGNHTGSQAISTVTGLQTALDAKASTSKFGNVNSLAYGTTLPGTATDGDVFFLVAP